ncbi:MAG: HDIG domain-containing protein [Deltaproteobacteria bacterium]|nr:HDIG domain-containing protein [Deltaproteobacteria bacterium]
MGNGKNAKERTRAPIKSVDETGAWAFLRDWRKLLYPAGLAGILLVLGVTVAVFINPAAIGPTLPISDKDIGTVAKFDIRAPISFTVPDVESTERKRREAEEAVLSVYDFEKDLGTENIRRLKEAFAEMTKVIKEHNSLLQGDGQPVEIGKEEKKGTPNGSKEKTQLKKVYLKKVESKPDKLAAMREADLLSARETLDAKLNAYKNNYVRILQQVVSEEDFIRLRKDRFSSKTLSAITLLIERTMRHMIVKNRVLLAAERSRGIMVRVLKDGVSQQEQIVGSFSKILDVEEALLRLQQTAVLELSDLPGPIRATIIRLAKSMIRDNLSFNRDEAEKRRREARQAVGSLEIRIQKGAKIIRDGDLIEKTHIRVFQQMKKLTEVSNALEMAIGTILLVIFMLIITIRFSAKNIRAFKKEAKDLLLMGLVLFIFILSTKLWYWIFGAVWDRFRLFPLESYYFAIPFAAGAMLVRFILNSEMALIFAAIASIIAGLLMENSIGFAIYCLVSSLVAAWAVASAKQRASLLKAGALTGLANMVLAVGLSLFAGDLFAHGFETLFNVIFAFAGGILVAMIITASAPVIEILFGYTTDIKLLELANLNHPLLKDLIVQAPGSYHHSIIVGSLTEAAAESINCNPLLARVMAYYHDIGKVKSPNYFSENQRDTSNPHDKLKPSLSATVLKTHVKDGAELARASKLGQPIIEAILQHHGTSLIKFFYQKAKEKGDHEDTVKEEEFRYPGPKPQSREVALVMLADSVEAAAKSISDPSPARLQGLVQKMINRIFADGQLDECDLTLKDLHEIARAFNRVLTGIYHRRPDYPESATKEREATERRTKSGEFKAASAKKDGAEKPADSDDKPEDLKRLEM